LRADAFLQLIAMKDCTLVENINIVNHVSFVANMWLDLISAEGRIQAFPTGSYYGPLRYRAGMQQEVCEGILHFVSKF
jgi:hypothetical protein